MSPSKKARVATVDAIRKHFPSMKRRYGGKPVAYLDGPGGTQVPKYVADRVADYLIHHNANTHWKYPTSAETDEMILDARGALADMMNGSPDEIAFGANMTTLTFHIARGLARGWSPRDRVVITELDHHGNVAPWQAVHQERGVQLEMAKMRTADGSLDYDDLERKINDDTRLVAIVAASNALGTIVDIPRVAAMARAKGALLYVDAVHFAPHLPVDVKAFDCDFVACSAYKFYGPHIGVVWGRRHIIEQLDVPKLQPAPSESPERLETGTQNHEGIVGAGAAVDWLASLAGKSGSRRQRLSAALTELHHRGEALFAQLWNGLGEIKGVTRFGLPPGSKRTPTVSFRVAGKSSDDVAVALAKKGMFVSHGDFYAATIIERLGGWPDGVVRVGCSAYTTASEIERVVDGVAALAKA